jgi:hypothetical protein
MKHYQHIIVASLLGITACNPALADQIKPGQWETTVMSDIKGMPPISQDQIARLKEMGIDLPVANNPIIAHQCITPEQAKLDKPIELPQTEDNCKVSSYKRKGNVISGEVLCNGAFTASGKFNMTIYSDVFYQGTWSMRGLTKGTGTLEQSSQISGKWIKDQCDADVPVYGKQ